MGFEIDLQRGCVRVPESKILKLKGLLKGVNRSNGIRARYLASLTGKIMSMSLALGPVARLMTRAMYAMLESRVNWDMLLWTEEAWEELQFWTGSLKSYNAQPIRYQPSAIRVVYSDASDVGFGGYVVEHGPLVAHGSWTANEAQQSSTWRELVAVSRVLESVNRALCGQRVRWFTDNLNVVRILRIGS